MLLCPTCGSSNLKDDSKGNIDQTSRLIECATCNRSLTYEELEIANKENIKGHVDKIEKEITKDLEKEISNMFKTSFGNSKNIRFK